MLCSTGPKWKKKNTDEKQKSEKQVNFYSEKTMFFRISNGFILFFIL